MRVLTNNTSLSAAEEETLGNLPASPLFRLLEFNTIGNFGATQTTVARSPISRNRQGRKGVVTDLDSGVAFDTDVTLDTLVPYTEAFLFATAVNQINYFEGNIPTATGYTVPALTAAQVATLRFEASGYATLMFAHGYLDSANNGLKPLTSQPAENDTELTFDGLTAAAAKANTSLAVAGIRAQTGDLAIAVTGSTASLTSGNNSATSNIDFTTIGLTVGQFIHIGGLLPANQFTGSVGYARVKSIAAAEVILDKLDATVVTATGAGNTVDLLFGRFIRNVPTDSSEFLERSYTMELSYPNLENPNGATMYEYAKGNYCNTLGINLPLTDKATLSYDFIGTDTPPPTLSRATNAENALEPTRTGAFSTTTDCIRMRIAEVDETGMYTDFKNLTLTFNNGVTPEKVLCNLGARYMNFGNFQVTIDGQLIFADYRIASAVRENRTVTMDFGLKNDDGGIMFDIPSMTLGGGGKEYPVNQSVLINTTGEAFQDAVLGTSIGVSIFPVLP